MSESRRIYINTILKSIRISYYNLIYNFVIILIVTVIENRLYKYIIIFYLSRKSLMF